MTPEQVQKLSDEELRIKVAKLMETGNWQYCEDLYGPDPYLDAPDYPKDLNACSDMEETLRLTGVEGTAYIGRLEEMILGRPCSENYTGTDLVKLARATARQRCEAFVIAKGNQDA